MAIRMNATEDLSDLDQSSASDLDHAIQLARRHAGWRAHKKIQPLDYSAFMTGHYFCWALALRNLKAAAFYYEDIADLCALVQKANFIPEEISIEHIRQALSALQEWDIIGFEENTRPADENLRVRIKSNTGIRVIIKHGISKRVKSKISNYKKITRLM